MTINDDYAADNETMVLVTGATGFIAMHCILQLLEQGYRGPDRGAVSDQLANQGRPEVEIGVWLENI